MEYNIKQMLVTEEALNEVKNLLHVTFPNRADKFSYDYLKWQYSDNPRGHVIAYNAYTNDGEIAAHYAVIPIEMIIDGERTKGVLSLNTATHPEHRGKRLFTILAEKTYAKAAELGAKFVIGVANANSTHGFLKNLGFYLIAPLEVKVGLRDPYKNDVASKKNHIYYDEETIRWRLQCPHFSYTAKGNTIYGKLDKPLFHSAVARIPNGMTGKNLGLRKTSLGFSLYIGFGNEVTGTYFNLPKFIKRSPFNLIFKDMSNGELPKMDNDNLLFQLIDYDVA